MPDLIDPTAVPVMRCSSCNGYPRPDVTLFYETLPEYEWTKAVRAVRSLQKGDVLLVVGTSSGNSTKLYSLDYIYLYPLLYSNSGVSSSQFAIDGKEQRSLSD